MNIDRLIIINSFFMLRNSKVIETDLTLELVDRWVVVYSFARTCPIPGRKVTIETVIR